MSETEAWRDRMGAVWAEHAAALEAQLEAAGEAGIAALAPRPGETAIDLGCGSGATTARLAEAVSPDGVALGIDVSPDQVAVARARVRHPGARFETADAQVHPFPPARFDALYSRFGCMFFDDPVAAFSNLRSALKPQGRAALVVWRAMALNPWAAIPAAAAAEVLGPAEPSAPGAPGPFGWASPEIFAPVLEAAGFRDLGWRAAEVEVPVAPAPAGDPVERAVAMLLRIGPAARRLRDTPEAAPALAERLAAPLSAHVADGAVRLPGAIWVITARA